MVKFLLPNELSVPSCLPRQYRGGPGAWHEGLSPAHQVFAEPHLQQPLWLLT